MGLTELLTPMEYERVDAAAEARSILERREDDRRRRMCWAALAQAEKWRELAQRYLDGLED